MGGAGLVLEIDHPYNEGARLRVLEVCYDLRHALMGDREMIFVENGMINMMIKDYAWLENYHRAAKDSHPLQVVR